EKVAARVPPATAKGTNGKGHAPAAVVEPSRAEPVRAEPVRPEPVRAEPVRAVIESDVSDEPARSEIDGLLRKLVETSSSDLHLRVGEPPILRIHGELKRMLDAEPLSNSRLEAMLTSIMPERNRSEYREVNDTDFAYEIPDLARFR